MQLFDGKIRGSFQRGVFALTRGKFTQGSQQFFFVALRFFLEGVEALAGVFLGAKLLEFDTVVIPIELFAQVPDPANEVALTNLTEREALPALEDHFDHAA